MIPHWSKSYCLNNYYVWLVKSLLLLELLMKLSCFLVPELTVAGLWLFFAIVLYSLFTPMFL